MVFIYTNSPDSPYSVVTTATSSSPFSGGALSKGLIDSLISEVFNIRLVPSFVLHKRVELPDRGIAAITNQVLSNLTLSIVFLPMAWRPE